MMSRPTLLAQSILDGNDPALNRPIPTFTIQESEIVNSDIQAVFDHHRPIGISPGYSAAGKLISLAIADDKNCRIIEFVQAKQDLGRGGKTSAPASTQGSIDGRHLLQDQILCRSVGDVFAFDMGPLSMSLHCDLAVRITNAVDIQSAFSAIDRKPLTAIMDALGDTVKVSPENVKHVFSNPIYDKEDRNRATDLAQRAWVSQFLVGYQNGAEIFEKVPRIDTKKLDPHRLDMISKIANDALRLDQKKPNQVKHDFNQSLDSANDQVRLSSTSFKNRLRSEQNVRMKVTGPQGAYFTSGAMADISGKSGNVISGRKLTDKTLTAVISIGRDDPTTAEAQRAATVLRILQGAKELLNSSPWIQNIWFPSSDDGSLSWPEEWSTQPQSPLRTPRLNAQHQSQSQSQPPSTALQHTLNPSQQAGVNYMLSDLDNHRITLVQGPPGTGKTSVIAAYVQFAIRRGQGGIWLVAQSNVAVKNIAEKLLAVGFLDWKLLVSKDFHFEWHEHIYHKVENNIIRSDSFFSGASKSNLRGCQVILCTISMLSNKLISKFTMEIPIRTLIVDEASQIEVGNYVSIFTTFQNTLRKACFIGDDKQLPPFGQEDLQDLQSIFEIPHLKKHVVFLDTQYRMPPQIGRIISELVYDNKLKSNPLHPITDQIIACYFIDIPGKERPLQDGSFTNDLECQAILQLARRLQELEKNYKIITPYEGQRSQIEDSMKTEGLEWGDKCFNVDSFQGNEEDFIIISVVRSRGLGFLNNLRRTNVMLSRCKQGMFIFSSRQWLDGIGADSLVGQLYKKMGPEVWLTLNDIEGDNF